jgi:hypothetical protein
MSVPAHRRPGRPKGKWAQVGRRCHVCSHEQRGRIDYLIVSGQGERNSSCRVIAEKFGVSEASVRSHSRNHISDEYRQAVLLGPFRGEDDLRQLAAEEGTSVLTNYRALFNSHRARWLLALEIGDDDAMIKHVKPMSEMLWRIGQLTKEYVQPGATSVQTNIFMTPDYYNFERRVVNVLKRHPAVLQDWLAEFRELPRPRGLIEIESDADAEVP